MLELGDALGGRILAWLGGTATLGGLLLFLGLAIARGWIGIEARMLVAAVGSLALIGGGVWLHELRGRTEAARVATGSGVAGAFATAMVAAGIYHLVSPLVAAALSAAVGLLAVLLSLRWRGRALGLVGLAGAQLSPLLLGAPSSMALVAILGVIAAAGAWLASSRRWGGLACATVLLAVPEWWRWLADGDLLAGSPPPLVLRLAVLVWFGAAGAVGAVGSARSEREEHRPVAAIVLLVMNACVLAVAGAWTLGPGGAAAWIAALALVHGAAGTLGSRWKQMSAPMRQTSLVLGAALGDVALGMSLSGAALAAGWAAAGLGFAWLIRHRAGEQRLLGLGLGAQVALTLVRAVIAAPPVTTTHGTASAAGVMALGALAACCLAGGWAIHQQAPSWGRLANLLGLATVAYLSATALEGGALVVAWVLEAVALMGVAARTDEPEALLAALAFGGLAAGHGLVVEAPPGALLSGVDSLSAAAEALGALIAGCLVLSRSVTGRGREGALAAVATMGLYLISVTITTLFTRGAALTGGVLGDPQQGQVVLSVVWGLAGVAALLIGLRGRAAVLRRAGLAVLLLTAGKVFLFDLSTLTSIDRVVSFVALGLMLLGGAHAWGRMRPAPLPDLRSVAEGER